MGDADRFHAKRAKVDLCPRLQPPQIGSGEPVLGQAAASKCKCYFSSVNRGGKAPEQVRERTDMVLVRMSQHDSFKVEAALIEVREVRQQQPDPEFALLGEPHAGSDDGGGLVA